MKVSRIGTIPKHDTFGERARFSAYFALDRLRGGVVAERVESDDYAFRHGTSEKETQERLTALLKHAADTTEFYKEYKDSTSLDQFPVVNKDIFRSHYDEMRSSACRDASDNRVMTTSGSTGTPFSMIQDHRKALRNTADSIFISMLGGYRIGEKIAFIRVWVDNVKKSHFQLFAENSIMMESSSLSDEAISRMLHIIRTKKVKCLTGYSSALGEISRFIDRTDYSMSGMQVHSILPISESMPAPVRKRLQEQFGCPVRSYYSNEENGIMGLEFEENESYYINSESYYYEILKMDCDEPAEEGELGRIVITDLNNYAFPVIRYDNGDSAVMKKIRHGDRYRVILTELYGRRSDILFDTEGNAVTPYVITNNLWDVEGVKQYRFLQTAPGKYELRLNGDREKMNVDEMLRRIRPALGADADITVTYVDEIPVLASGKRKYIENLCPELMNEYAKQNKSV
ncbi:MAG: phenylacetate--CoA ligase family protein [Lachnospiraceae bacterium]|nr:phenylacetate--CoA ligase family protein [Lachnospiraceae bacterium]